ncbi:hypothetical protein [Sulfitobacter pontiacus]|uniref:hypothetical protein n=1 Tax=Sulfitobacter pontiacus TaxID=60137 RepID=UPI0021A630A2|nr:hypothetical protein [Sulfitobacter pontiacus]UWR17530.1 hypothetical protein K3755_07345 [Sulfitobacter pontiacus]
MAPPSFNKQTVDTLARRARYQCSNPDCRAHTVAPNSDPEKSTTIGEAAHIMGANVGSKRFDKDMSDLTRASITNGIWLCRNCHGKIDRDDNLFPPALLFAWRKEHENWVLRELGTRGDQLRHDLELAQYTFLNDCPPIVQRIVLDKPVGWEWRLAAELLRHLNAPQLKRLRNLQAGLSYSPRPRVTADNLISFISERTHIMGNLIGPLINIFDRLTESFGPPGEAGDAEQIYDCCILLRDILAASIDHEEILYFTSVPEEGKALRDILIDAIGRNLVKLGSLPQTLDEVVALIGTNHGGTENQPKIVTYTVEFDLPEEFTNNFNKELKTLERKLRI